MKSFFKKEWRLKWLDNVEDILHSFSPAERVIFIIVTIIFAASVVWLLVKISDNFLISVPARGGSFIEAEIGTPRFANPLLAMSPSDHDLSMLVYSGLLRDMPDGSIVPDLAESYSVSPDGLTYTFIIRNDATFQDGADVTADDVAFTVTKAQDPALKSPEFANWNGVTVKVLGPKEISFTLKQPYAFFTEDATMGILPKHIWQNVTDDNFAFSDYNTTPVGSGPYKVSSVSRDSSGVPTQYSLSAFDKFALGEPYISAIILKIFSNDSDAFDALKKGSVNALAGIDPSEMPISIKGEQTIIAPFTRIFGLFFNQNQNAIFADKNVRQALDISAPREDIIDTVLDGFGSTIIGPLPATVLKNNNNLSTSTASSTISAQALLSKNGWKLSTTTNTFTKTVKKQTTPLSFSISTGDVAELAATANILKDVWQSLGATVDVKVFNQSDLAQTVVETRNYDALLLGMVVGRHPDLYAFWDSSQRNYPGLNVAEYTNAKADKVLSDMRATSTPEAQENDQNAFLSYVASDTPAVFLYTPDFIYAVPKSIKNISIGPITLNSDRFENVWQWYINTEKIWNFFGKEK